MGSKLGHYLSADDPCPCFHTAGVTVGWRCRLQQPRPQDGRAGAGAQLAAPLRQWPHPRDAHPRALAQNHLRANCGHDRYNG